MGYEKNINFPVIPKSQKVRKQQQQQQQQQTTHTHTKQNKTKQKTKQQTQTNKQKQQQQQKPDWTPLKLLFIIILFSRKFQIKGFHC